MSDYLFVLGRVRNLCQAELESVLKREQIIYQKKPSSQEIFLISSPEILDVTRLIKILGGVIKIAKVTEVVTQSGNLLDSVVKLIQDSNSTSLGKIVFGLSGYGNISLNDLHLLSKKIKDKLRDLGFKTRFVLPSEGVGLATVVIKNQGLLEIIISETNENYVLAKTMVIQDFENWGKRDFSRPASDSHRGMLPPKVARMMVNLGVETWDSKCEPNYKLLDPFCGVGTILSEGLMAGVEVVGSDHNEEALEKAKRNLDWLISQYPDTSQQKFSLFNSDATHISKSLEPSSINCIVTEPYLGPPIEAYNLNSITKKLDRIVLGLEKLYIGCLKDWLRVLKKNGRIIIACPSFMINNRETFFVKKPIDICENLGYILEAGPYQYYRPQAIVIRNIFILRKKNGTH